MTAQTEDSRNNLDATDDVPMFGVPAPDVFSRPQDTIDVVVPVLDHLAVVVSGIGPEHLAKATPCRDYDVAALRDHVLGWLQFFAAALNDPQRRTERLDPMAYRATEDERDLGDVVRQARDDLANAVRAGVQEGDVVVSQARMTGPAVLGMLQGEYVVHGWDLARATGQRWRPGDAAVTAAHEMFAGMVSPQYRGTGPDAFFGEEVAVADDAPALDRLLGFAGRDPNWTPLA